MISVQEALDLILATVPPLPVARIPLADCLGLVLAEDVHADLDSPPFDKSLMDGFAVRSADLAAGSATLVQIEEVTAGRVPSRAVGPGEATRIMTGAPIPQGADAVVPIELVQLSTDAQGQVRVQVGAAVPMGRNILRQGASTKAGTRVLPAGRRLRGQELGCLAELGRAEVAVRPAPRVAILATGDELVAVHETPGPGQIRNSNATMLAAQVRQAGAQPAPLGVAWDTLESLREKIAAGLSHDVLLLSGGVSAGNLDLVPTVLRELGVREVFHKVQVKPGQPLWFGIREIEGQRPCCVFGLPGNPVSSMVCCELFARTAFRKLMGDPQPAPLPIAARLTTEFKHQGNRPTYHPAKLEFTPRGAEVTTIRWAGSADLTATVEANAMCVFPAGDRVYNAGESMDVIPW